MFWAVARKRRMIYIFAGGTSNLVGNAVLRLNCLLHKYVFVNVLRSCKTRPFCPDACIYEEQGSRSKRSHVFCTSHRAVVLSSGTNKLFLCKTGCRHALCDLSMRGSYPCDWVQMKDFVAFLQREAFKNRKYPSYWLKNIFENKGFSLMNKLCPKFFP